MKYLLLALFLAGLHTLTASAGEGHAGNPTEGHRYFRLPSMVLEVNLRKPVGPCSMRVEETINEIIDREIQAMSEDGTFDDVQRFSSAKLQAKEWETRWKNKLNEVVTKAYELVPGLGEALLHSLKNFPAYIIDLQGLNLPRTEGSVQVVGSKEDQVTLILRELREFEDQATIYVTKADWEHWVRTGIINPSRTVIADTRKDVLKVELYHPLQAMMSGVVHELMLPFFRLEDTRIMDKIVTALLAEVGLFDKSNFQPEHLFPEGAEERIQFLTERGLAVQPGQVPLEYGRLTEDFRIEIKMERGPEALVGVPLTWGEDKDGNGIAETRLEDAVRRIVSLTPPELRSTHEAGRDGISESVRDTFYLNSVSSPSKFPTWMERKHIPVFHRGTELGEDSGIAWILPSIEIAYWRARMQYPESRVACPAD